MHTAARLKAEQKAGTARPLLAGKVLGMIFQKPSLRTRVSFEVGMRQLGGHAMYLAPDEIQLGRRESVPDAARVLSRFVDGIMIRTFAHREVEVLAEHATVPVVNGLSDFSHPCQALADMLTIYEKRGRLEGLTLAYVGDGNNVAHSLLLAAGLAGMNMAVASPQGYECDPQVVARARASAQANGCVLRFVADPREAVRDADIIYTDVWVSMGQETEQQQRVSVFDPYRVDARLVELASPDVLVMHCLPAHRGEEITDEVLDGPHSIVLDQAENRLHAQKAVLALLMGNGGAG
ncbi:MAG: ornithine carbamoyltransferase [Chloroflexi bacterium]|nr:ornithine carbamoyltransferase [Chloroflexota bacterium]